MALDFSKMSNWGDLIKNTNYKEKGGYEKDERFLKVEVDENGKNIIILRFLPDKNGTPFVNLKSCGWDTFSEALKKKVYCIADLPDAIGVKSPMQEFREFLWNCGNSRAVDEAKGLPIPNQYISNVYVVKDSVNPDNEGKVFLYRFGKQVLEKLQMAMVEDGINVWNPLEQGANFKLRRNFKSSTAKIPTYENSSVENQSSFNGMDEEEATKFIEEKTFELGEFLDKDYFDSYEDLKKKLTNFLKKYTPKALEVDEWNDLLSKYLGEETSGSTREGITQSNKKSAPKEVDVDDLLDDMDDEPKKPAKKVVEDEEEITPKKKEEPKKPAKKVDDDDDLDALLAEI